VRLLLASSVEPVVVDPPADAPTNQPSADGSLNVHGHHPGSASSLARRTKRATMDMFRQSGNGGLAGVVAAASHGNNHVRAPSTASVNGLEHTVQVCRELIQSGSSIAS